jgi:hypothetical protein
VAAKQTYFDVLTAAINDLTEHGFDSAERVAYWSRRIKEAAQATMAPPPVMEQMLRDALAQTYRKLIDQGQIAQFHQGIARFTLEKVRPQLRAELDRRIMASANLIRLNREQAIQKTLQRFQGWSTSIPAGGSDAVDKRETKTDIRKALTQLPFEERRVLIDQGHKLRASLSEILARDGQAIAMTWRSHWRQAGYNYREDHKERDGHTYALRGSWALDKGLMKAGPDGYYEDITSVGEEPFCRCYAAWIYALRGLPDEMLTAKGRDALAEAKRKIAAMA